MEATIAATTAGNAAAPYAAPYAAPCVQHEFSSEDEYWRDAHCSEAYVRGLADGLDYEDFAPAYCVGSIGYVQYGGSFDDARNSLVSNWVRIKGDSRLPLDLAECAMRAAWDRMAARTLADSPADTRVVH